MTFINTVVQTVVTFYLAFLVANFVLLGGLFADLLLFGSLNEYFGLPPLSILFYFAAILQSISHFLISISYKI